MAKTISTLAIKLTASSATLQQDLSKAGGAVQGYADKVSGVAMKIAGALAGVFAVSKITGAVNDSINAIDDLAKSADRMGVATEELQTFRLAADLAGISAESLTTAFRFSQRALSEAASGTKEYADSFAALGLSTAALRQMGAAEQFQAIVTALQRVTDQTDRTRLAMELFGRTGTQMLTLKPDAISSAAQDIERMGGAISRLDAAKVEEAQDAMTRTKAAVSVLWAELTIKLAPAIEGMADKLTNLIVWLNGLDAGAVKAAAEMTAFAVAFGTVLWLIPKVIAGVRAVVSALQAMATAQAITTALSGPAGWARLAVAAGVAAGAVGMVSEAFAGLNDQAGQASGAAVRVADSVAGINSEPLNELAAAADGAGDALGRTDRAARRLSDGSIAPTAYRITINGQEQIYRARDALQAVNQQSFDGLHSGLRETDILARRTATALEDVGAGGLDDATQFAKETEAALRAAAKAAEDFWEKHDRGADKLAEAQRSAERWSKEVESPGEKLARQLKELQGLWNQRLISEDVFERGNAKIRADYEAAFESAKEVERTLDRIEGTPAILKGSVEDLAMIDRARRAVMEARQAKGEAITPDVGEIEPPTIPAPNTAPALAAIRGLRKEAGIDLGTVPFGRQAELEAEKIDAAIGRIREAQSQGMSWEGMIQADMAIRRLQAQLQKLKAAAEIPPVEVATIVEPPQIPAPNTAPALAAIRGLRKEAGIDLGTVPFGRQAELEAEKIDAAIGRIREAQSQGMSWEGMIQADMAIRRLQAQLQKLKAAAEIPPVEVATIVEPPQIPPVEADVSVPDLGEPVRDWAGRSMAEIESMMGALEGQQLEPYVEDIEPPQPRKLEPYVEDIEPPQPEPAASDLAGRLQQIQDAGKRMQEMTQAQQELLKIQARQAATLEAIEKNTKEKTKVTEATI